MALEEADGRPSSSMSTLKPAGVLPRPGICMMSPQSARQETGAGVRPDVAHRDAEAGRRVGERRVGREREVRLGHADREPGEPVAGVLLDLLPRRGQEVDAVGLVDARGDLLDLDVDRVGVLVRRRRTMLGCSQASATASAISAAPSPPFEKPSFRTAACAPCSIASFCTSATSSSVSPGKRLAATTQGRRTPSRSGCGGRGWPSPPRSRAGCRPRSCAGRPRAPAWCFSAFAVATITTAFGANPPARQTMSMNFSMPRSEPKPASVIEVVAQLAAGQVGDDRAVAVGDVAERADVHEAGLALERLDQVRLERVLQEHGHRAGAAHLLGRDRVRRRRRSRR